MPLRRALVGGLVALFVVLAFADATTGSTGDFRPVTRVEAEQLLRSATVRLVAFGCRTGIEAGSGFAFGDGSVLTSRHVVDGAVALSFSGEYGPTRNARARVSPLADVARLDGPATSEHGLRLADSDPRPGSTVTLAGYADGDLQIVPARVVGYAAGPPLGQPGSLIEVTPAPRPGMSGGPVLDESGHLAGLVYAQETAAGVGLLIPASTLRRALGVGPMELPGGCR